MNLKLSTWLLVALAGGAFAIGCGSSSNSTSSSQSTPVATAPNPAIPGSGTGSTGSATGSTATRLTQEQAKQAVSTCKHGVQSQSAIPSGAKAKLEKTCEKVSSGDPNALRQVAREACVELINASHLPSGAIRQRALALCNVNTSATK